MIALMFHSIGCEKENWYRRYLSVSLKHFDNFCNYLVAQGYETINLYEWFNTIMVSPSENKKKIVLTFDDGYLDNWVYAMPILKKYGLKGTVFVNPEFVEDSDHLRPTIEDVWSKKINFGELQALGFLNWAEIRIMDKSQIMDVQSHSSSHNFYFKSNKIIDLYKGQDKFNWLPWIYRRDRKPYYLNEDQSTYVPYGTPVFDFGRSLSLRRYLPDPKIVEYGQQLFTSNSISKEEIIKKVQLKIEEFPGRFETNDEMLKRFDYELCESKKIIEKKLNKSVDFLCWPGGGYNNLSLQISIECGFKASTGSYYSHEPIQQYANYKRLVRRPISSFILTKHTNFYINNSMYLVNQFKIIEGKKLYRLKYILTKLFLMAIDFFSAISSLKKTPVSAS